jgi:hypothetical protein
MPIMSEEKSFMASLFRVGHVFLPSFPGVRLTTANHAKPNPFLQQNHIEAIPENRLSVKFGKVERR